MHHVHPPLPSINPPLPRFPRQPLYKTSPDACHPIPDPSKPQPPMALMLRPPPAAAMIATDLKVLLLSPLSSSHVRETRLPYRYSQIPAARVKIVGAIERKSRSMAKASNEPVKLTCEPTENGTQILEGTGRGSDPFEKMKDRFLTFKKQDYMENLGHYQNLAQAQAPEFMVIACADSRVCPSKILGFQPGEAFTVRTIANLVPPMEHGASETTAALEFAVNSLEVPNILVVGHSRCGGIRALMSMEDDAPRSFIGGWVSIAKTARLSTKAAAGNLSFDKQCSHCEKESINGSLLNLLTYPWIKKRLKEGTLALHGGYYNFVDCTFEKWTLVYKEDLEGGSKYAIKDRSQWN